MSEGIFQTFLVLATFNIALVSVTIANYAVSASYLGRETRLSRKRMENRLQKLTMELPKKGELDTIKKEVKQAENDIQRLRTRIFLLSWYGAVVGPSIFFTISFVSAVVGMNSGIFSSDVGVQGLIEQQVMIFSSGTIVIGFISLLGVIKVIDSAAKEIPLPKMDIYFENKTKIIICKKNAQTSIFVCIRNDGEDVADDLRVFVNFPPTFKVMSSTSYEIAQQKDVGTDFPNYSAVIFEIALLYVDEINGSEIMVMTPTETKRYNIPVSFYERKTGLTEANLEIDVVD